MHADRVAGAERETDDVRCSVAVVVDDQRRSAVGCRSVRRTAIELKRPFAAIDDDAIRKVVGYEKVGNVVVIETADVLQRLPESAGDEPFRGKAAIA